MTEEPNIYGSNLKCAVKKCKNEVTLILRHPDLLGTKWYLCDRDFIELKSHIVLEGTNCERANKLRKTLNMPSIKTIKIKIDPIIMDQNIDDLVNDLLSTN